jgi:iduronate 2-sulfatase
MQHRMMISTQQPAYLLLSRYIFLLVCMLPRFAHAQQAGTRPNVLMIMVDDLRAAEILDSKDYRIITPNIDGLAKQSCVFTRQFVTVPTCGASRCGILTGMLPHKTVELDNDAISGTLAKLPRTGRPETFIDQLRRNGYYTVGIGKISHSPDGYIYPYGSPRSNQPELPYSWDEMLFNPGKWQTGWNAFFGYADGTNRTALKAQVKPYENAAVEDDAYPDGLSAALAVEKLSALSASKQPFFLSVGFFKPHLPFTAPKKYWDLYEESKIPLTPSPDIPSGINPKSLHTSQEFNQYRLGDEKASLEKPVSDAYARKLRHAYYAAASYADAQIGKVLTALKASGLEKNTIVILWTDHGWHLGDDRVWGKHTLFDWALRSVLMVKTPQTKKGIISQKIISAVDVYPTLMELCGLSMPHQTDGKSFVRLLHNPNDQKWENAAYSYFNDGLSVRTDRYRLTKYFRKEEPSIELFDHTTDPYENNNIAGQYPALVKELLQLLEKGNTGVYNAGRAQQK